MKEILNQEDIYGGIIGYGGGTITNSYNKGDIAGENVSNSSVAGIVGYVNETTIIESCYNKGIIEGSGPIGGIIGDGNGNGIKTITNCYNEGAINGGNIVGGIVGNGLGTVTITNSYNKGEVITIGNYIAGGIIGNGGGTVTIINCFNKENVTGEQFYPVGGIIGNGGGTITNCYNEGDVTGKYATAPVGGISGNGGGTITNCYNKGDITGKSAPVGGISGSGGTITNCHNTGNIKGENPNYMCEISIVTVNSTCSYLEKATNANANGATAKTAAEMEKIMSIQNFVTLMNTKVEENNENDENIKWKTWTIENGTPIFEK